MNKKFLGIFLVIFIFCCQFLMAGFIVSPMEFHLKVKKDDDETNAFWVGNRGDQTIRLKISVNDFLIQPDGKEVFVDPGTLEHSCSKWLEIDTEEFELEAGKGKSIKFKMTVPSDKQGSYWTMIFIEQVTNPREIKYQQEGRSFQINTFHRVGVRIFEDIPGPKRKEIYITGIDPKMGDKTFMSFDLKVDNKGDTLLYCQGSLDIKDERGEVVKKIVINKFRAYPKVERIIKIVLEDEIDPGIYSVLGMIDYGGDDLIAGETLINIKGPAGMPKPGDKKASSKQKAKPHKKATSKASKKESRVKRAEPAGVPEPMPASELNQKAAEEQEQADETMP